MGVAEGQGADQRAWQGADSGAARASADGANSAIV